MMDRNIEFLTALLQQALLDERYEEAAKLRDRIKKLKDEGPKDAAYELLDGARLLTAQEPRELEIRYHIEIHADFWKQYYEDHRMDHPKQMLLDHLSYLLSNFKGEIGPRAIHDGLKSIQENASQIPPDDAQALRISTYQEGPDVLDFLKEHGCNFYYSEYHSIYDEIWLLVDRLPDILPNNWSPMNPEQRARLTDNAKQHTSYRIGRMEYLESLLPYVDSGMIRVWKP